MYNDFSIALDGEFFVALVYTWLVEHRASQPALGDARERSNLFTALRYSAHEGMLIATENVVERVSHNTEGTDPRGEISAQVLLLTGINSLYFCINDYN